MLELGRRHAALEAEGALEALLATLAPDPVYEFHPLGRGMRGDAQVRRFYEQFCSRYLALPSEFELVEEWVSERSVAQEYVIRFHAHAAHGIGPEGETHRVLGVLYARDGLLGGERVFASERYVELLTGPLYGELEPLAAR